MNMLHLFADGDDRIQPAHRVLKDDQHTGSAQRLHLGSTGAGGILPFEHNLTAVDPPAMQDTGKQVAPQLIPAKKVIP